MSSRSKWLGLVATACGLTLIGLWYYHTRPPVDPRFFGNWSSTSQALPNGASVELTFHPNGSGISTVGGSRGKWSWSVEKTPLGDQLIIRVNARSVPTGPHALRQRLLNLIDRARYGDTIDRYFVKYGTGEITLAHVDEGLNSPPSVLRRSEEEIIK